ncbi:hypothetical protein [Brachyspira pilosicoli]|uniref:hypothetical protein n=1 Tax=Brachyspira pilosicoli TaxID=52584 RepID=UPI00248FD075|nr:hypothetical protein [Brachyspira pilosicoli]
MKKTLLALMLVSSLFVISCGADATKPGDLQAKSYESKTGTATYIGTATTSNPITADAIYAGLNAEAGDSVKITKIVSVKSQDATTKQYTTDVTFTETKNTAGDIVLSVTPTTANLSGNIEIAYQYKIDTLPTDSTGAQVDVSKIKPTLEKEIVYNQTTHNTSITVTDPALSLGKKSVYKLYSKNTSTEPAVETGTITKDGSMDLNTTTIASGLQDGDKIYYKIWVY